MENVISNSTNSARLKKEIQNIFLENLEQFIKPEYKEKVLMSRKETAKYLCISLPTLHDWTKRGIIKAHRIGNRVLYKFNDIETALKEVKTTVKRGGLSC